MKKRVVITGIGIIAPCGTRKELLWDSVLKGESFAGLSQTLAKANLPVKIACEIKNLENICGLAPRTLMRLDRQGILSLVSAKAAIEDSKLHIDEDLSFNTGVFEGTALASLNTNFERHTKYLNEGLKKISPLALLNGLTGNASGMVSQEFKIHGPAITFSSGCVSSSYAIGYGFKKIQNGELIIAVSGGAEAPVSEEIAGMFSKANLLSTRNDTPAEACKPFDKDRSGFVLGEGGAYLVLEELEHAINRNAGIYAEIIGFGESTDAYHGSSPEPEGRFYAKAMELALGDASILPEDINYINVHGTATKLNDPAETRAIKSVFGGSKPAVSSTKQVTGHLLGACGSIEMVITCLAVINNKIPPVSNLTTPGPDCDLNVIKYPVEINIKYAMCNNLSFGGRNSSIIISKFKN
jgi:3-oxoacyl-[acyl-carrier-protein] synthase II